MVEEIGRTLRGIRQARGKSLDVIAGLAGISPSYLSRLESGDRALDRRSLIAALASALEVAPSEITASALATPRESAEDRALQEVRSALLAVSLGEPRGEVQPIDQLRVRVASVVAAQNEAESAVAGSAIPALIRDLHTTAQHGAEAEVLRLLPLAHVQGTQAWLTAVGAPIDLSWQAVLLGRRCAERLDDPIPRAVSAYGTALGLLSAGAFEHASRVLDMCELPLRTTEEIQLAGSLALASSLVSAARGDRSEQSAALEHAAELSERTGETNMLGFGFGPSNVAVWRMQGALENGDHAEAAGIAERIRPDALPVRARQAVYWREYGRALAQLPKRRDAAVSMLRKAEEMAPEHVHRHPLTCSTLTELVAKAKRDATGRELRGIAYRAGLHV